MSIVAEPYLDDNGHDELGYEYGIDDNPFFGPIKYDDEVDIPEVPCIEARKAVESWPIKHVGRRPADHITRDLLLNSMWRDRRPRLFHSMAGKPPAWIEDSVNHLIGQYGREQAIQ